MRQHHTPILSKLHFFFDIVLFAVVPLSLMNGFLQLLTVWMGENLEYSTYV